MAAYEHTEAIKRERLHPNCLHFIQRQRAKMRKSPFQGSFGALLMFFDAGIAYSNSRRMYCNMAMPSCI
jgi:hypothetical protein